MKNLCKRSYLENKRVIHIYWYKLQQVLDEALYCKLYEWSLKTGGLYSEVDFNTDETVL